MRLPQTCMGLWPLSDGWASIDQAGAVWVTVDGTSWQQRGSLPKPPSLWDFADGAALAARGDDWLAVSLDDGQTWQTTELPVDAQTEAAAVVADGFVVTAMGPDQTQYLLHRAFGDTTWSVTELVGVPAISDLEGYNSRLIAATEQGLWDWESPTSETQEISYTVEHATRFIGTDQPSVNFADSRGDPEQDGGFHLWGPWPQDTDGSWTLVLARRMPPPFPTSRWDADLVLLIDSTSGTVADALLVHGSSVGVSATIGLSCEGRRPAVLLGPNQNALRAWTVSVDPLALTEIAPLGLREAELDSACLDSR